MFYFRSLDKNNKDFEQIFKVLSRKGAKRMKKFNLEDYDNNYVMNCETGEEARIFTKFLHEQDLSWCTEECYLTDNKWHLEGKSMCYNFKEGAYGDIDFYKRQQYEILKFSDFDWSEETKEKGDTDRLIEAFEEVNKILKGDKKTIGIFGEFRKVEIVNHDKVFNDKYEVIELEIFNEIYDEFKEYIHKFESCRTNVGDCSVKEMYFLIKEEVLGFKELISKFNEKYEKKETLEELKEEYRKMASEYNFKKNEKNFEIDYSYHIDRYCVKAFFSSKSIVNNYFTHCEKQAEDFCKRMNEALEREKR